MKNVTTRYCESARGIVLEICKAKTHGNKEGKVRHKIQTRRRSRLLPSDCGQSVAHVGKVNIAVGYDSRNRKILIQMLSLYAVPLPAAHLWEVEMIKMICVCVWFDTYKEDLSTTEQILLKHEPQYLGYFAAHSLSCATWKKVIIYKRDEIFKGSGKEKRAIHTSKFIHC